MSASRLENVRVAAIMTDGFEQIEFTVPKEAIEEEGGVVHILVPAERNEEHVVHGMNHLHPGDEFHVDSTIEEADPEDYDAVLLPGGLVNSDKLRMNKAAHDFLRHVDEQGKSIFAICHGPWILASANLLRGRTMTSYYTIQDDMRNAGAVWVDEPVVVEENFIFSRHPGDLEQFSKAVVDTLSQTAHARAHFAQEALDTEQS